MIFDEINNRISNLSGHLGYYFIDLSTNESYGFNEEDEFLAASVIKLPIYLSICRFVSRNETSFDTVVKVKNEDKLPSCGGLNCFTGDIDINIESLCNLMIRLSDNTATNVLINYFGIDRLNNEFVSMGLHKTKIYRLLFDSVASSKGLENKICLKELSILLKQIYDKTFINEYYSNYVNDCLLKQQVNHKIPGYLNDEIEVAHKTGEDDNLSNDVGIVYTKKPFILCFAGHDTSVTDFEIFIRETSRDLVNIYNK
ncbi:MAG: serine hydrolase [Erysipelotrichaceae bacterium]|nr:serine hydrolase [Erysipelotrichaceae bacterium]